MRAANSALFKGRNDISTINRAVARLGVCTARKVIFAIAFRPIFVRPSMHSLLRHSLAMADLAHHLAAQTLVADPEEAFLCGLLHDIGKLLMDQLNLFDSARMRGLVENGCPQVYAENLLFGHDHGSVGGQIAATWRFPARLVDAIRHHHQPELANSPLAHVLYLAESQLEPSEDLVSEVRAHLCLGSTGLTSKLMKRTGPASLYL